jgi:hypothetical protein
VRIERLVYFGLTANGLDTWFQGLGGWQSGAPQ